MAYDSMHMRDIPCEYGVTCGNANCRYRHDGEDFYGGERQGKKVCLKYLAGVCRSNNTCIDYHPKDMSYIRHLRGKYKRTICRYGDDCHYAGCLFSHPRDNDQELQTTGSGGGTPPSKRSGPGPNAKPSSLQQAAMRTQQMPRGRAQPPPRQQPAPYDPSRPIGSLGSSVTPTTLTAGVDPPTMDPAMAMMADQAKQQLQQKFATPQGPGGVGTVSGSEGGSSVGGGSGGLAYCGDTATNTPTITTAPPPLHLQQQNNQSTRTPGQKVCLPYLSGRNCTVGNTIANPRCPLYHPREGTAEIQKIRNKFKKVVCNYGENCHNYPQCVYYHPQLEPPPETIVSGSSYPKQHTQPQPQVQNPPGTGKKSRNKNNINTNNQAKENAGSGAGTKSSESSELTPYEENVCVPYLYGMCDPSVNTKCEQYHPADEAFLEQLRAKLKKIKIPQPTKKQMRVPTGTDGSLTTPSQQQQGGLQSQSLLLKHKQQQMQQNHPPQPKPPEFDDYEKNVCLPYLCGIAPCGLKDADRSNCEKYHPEDQSVLQGLRAKYKKIYCAMGDDCVNYPRCVYKHPKENISKAKRKEEAMKYYGITLDEANAALGGGGGIECLGNSSPASAHGVGGLSDQTAGTGGIGAVTVPPALSMPTVLPSYGFGASGNSSITGGASTASTAATTVETAGHETESIDDVLMLASLGLAEAPM